jgi:predicted RNA binding protein YcfA (HicA-like mRNA interferase family)
VKPWTFSDAVRAALARGWTLDHVTGSHHVFKKTGVVQNLPIPRHRGTLRPGTQRAIMRILGITPDQL